MIIIFFLFGLLIGSFLNVLVYRLRVAEDLVFDRSKCPHCAHLIRWYDNIPVLSFILLKFHCRDCKKKISWQYPLVELTTGILFALFGFMHFDIADMTSWLPVIYFWGIAAMLLVIFVYDLLYMEIPGVMLWVAIFWAVVFNLIFDYMKNTPLQSIFSSDVYSGTLAAVIAFLFFFFLVVISKEKWMGMGDAYLAIILGFLLGWPEIILGLFLAFFIGSIFGIVLIIGNKKSMQSQIPFAPFLILGSFIALFCYESIMTWYFNFIF